MAAAGSTVAAAGGTMSGTGGVATLIMATAADHSHRLACCPCFLPQVALWCSLLFARPFHCRCIPALLV